MSLSRSDKLARVAVIEGNLTIAKLARLLQPCTKMHGDALACTDGKVIYVGDDFWRLPLNEQYFILNHEFLHIILKHAERGKNKNLRIYNLAADIVINKLLCERGRTMPTGNVAGVTYDSLNVPQELKTTEEVYKFLLENVNENEKSHDDLVVESSSIPEEVIKEVESLAKEEADSNYSDQALKEQIVSVPQDFREKVDWFNDLMSEIGRLAIRTNIKTYKKPSRVKVPGCLLRGGFIEQNIPKINIIIDVSGSMGNEPLNIASKIHAMRGYLKVFKPNYYWLNQTWGEISDITNIPLGGGTDLSNVRHIRGADLNVLVTDCEDENGVDAINNSANRFYIVTNNNRTRIKNSHNCRVFITNKF